MCQVGMSERYKCPNCGKGYTADYFMQEHQNCKAPKNAWLNEQIKLA
jgi:uncharacterized protein (DUF983 family)